MNKKISRAFCFIICIGCLLTGCGNEEILLEYKGTNAEESSGNVISGNDEVVLHEETVIFIHICGGVESPGVYELPSGSRIYDAVEAAGGFSEGADAESVNLVELLEDGEQIRIAYVGENEKADSGLIDINQADVSLLCEIPGIGESRAEAIVNYREEHGRFSKTEDLMQIPGIKEGLFAKIQPYIECK